MDFSLYCFVVRFWTVCKKTIWILIFFFNQHNLIFTLFASFGRGGVSELGLICPHPLLVLFISLGLILFSRNPTTILICFGLELWADMWCLNVQSHFNSISSAQMNLQLMQHIKQSLYATNFYFWKLFLLTLRVFSSMGCL